MIRHVADAIPQLADQDPSLFGVSVCTVDGQRFSLGDSGETFCLQSCTNPFTYGMALEENGIQKVHEHVGREPSGRTFNDFVLKPIPSIERVKPEREAIPHNPMISAGAILCSSMIKPELPVAARLSHYEKVWSELCGGKKPNCAANVMLSERENADRIKTLGFMMKASLFALQSTGEWRESITIFNYYPYVKFFLFIYFSIFIFGRGGADVMPITICLIFLVIFFFSLF